MGEHLSWGRACREVGSRGPGPGGIEASRTLAERKACRANNATMNSNQTLSAEKYNDTADIMWAQTKTNTRIAKHTHRRAQTHTKTHAHCLTQLDRQLQPSRKTAQHLPGKWKSAEASPEQVSIWDVYNDVCILFKSGKERSSGKL